MKAKIGAAAMEPLSEAQEYDEYDEKDQRSAEEAAGEAGCVVEYSDPHTLQLDIDSQEDLDFFYAQVGRLFGAMPELVDAYNALEIRSSKSGHWHLTLKFESPMSVERRIMLQALLGSDRVREILSLSRHLYGAENPIRLFRPKGEG